MDWDIAWYIPVLIFLGRICDVSINTIRTMLVIAGHRAIATILGFLEVLIWMLAAGFALRYLHNPIALVSYAGGFATGVAVGMWLEQRIGLGYRMVQIISPKNAEAVTNALRDHGYRVTHVDGKGREGPVDIAYSVVRRKELPKLQTILAKVAPNAFLAIERVDTARGGAFAESTRFGTRSWERFGLVRK